MGANTQVSITFTGNIICNSEDQMTRVQDVLDAINGSKAMLNNLNVYPTLGLGAVSGMAQINKSAANSIIL